MPEASEGPLYRWCLPGLVLVLGACNPTVKIEAPDKPIGNQSERQDRTGSRGQESIADLDELLAENPDLFCRETDMRITNKTRLPLLVFFLSFLFAAPGFAIDLDSAKAQGLVGEKLEMAMSAS